MSTDLSRTSHRPLRHFQDVRFQQGRLVTDADSNEQADILAHLRRQHLRDVIGPAGAPKDTDAFRVEWLDDGTVQDLALLPGRFYVDGLLCELEAEALAVTGFDGPQDVRVASVLADGRPFAPDQWVRLTDGTTERTVRIGAAAGDALTLATAENLQALYGGASVTLRRLVTYATQSDFPLADDGSDSLATVLAGAAGSVVAYLDVWDRTVTGAEDPALLDEALGGADTTTRTQRVWQLRLAETSASGCAAFGPGWQPGGAVARGRLRAQAEAGGVSTDPCIIPSSGGYRRLENQLYRVEVFGAGAPGIATFLWSRDNASRLARIEEINGDTVRVRAPGRDVLTGVQASWIEVTDRRRMLRGEPGHLARVTDVQGDTLTLMNPIPAGLFDPATTVTLLRRWDSDGAQPLTDGAYLDIESGVQVEFEPGTYTTGDHWLIPARATSGRLLWPSVGGEALFQPRHGTDHVFAPLAFIADPASPDALSDCRPLFPPLTNLDASDVGFDDANCALGGVTTVQEALDALCAARQECCTITLRPGPNWTDALTRLRPGDNVQLCFQAGEYPVQAPVVLQGLGDVKVTGSGPASRLLALNGETVLRFQDCGSVLIRDLYAEGRALGATGALNGLNGPLTFRNCEAVHVEGVTVKCASGPERAGTCLTIDGAQPTPNGDVNAGMVRVRHCDLRVGHEQVGLLILNATRVHAEDNVIRVGTKPRRLGLYQLLENKHYRAGVRRWMIRRGRVTDPETLVGGIPDDWVVFEVQQGNRRLSVTFETEPALQSVWNQYAAWQDLQGVQSERELYWHLRNVADRVLTNRGDYRTGNRLFTAFRPWYRRLRNANPAIADLGLVVSGIRGGDDVRVLNNTVHGARQGLHLVVDDGEAGTVEGLGAARVRGNTVTIFQGLSFARASGIHVGSCASLLVEDNVVEVRRFGNAEAIEVPGIAVAGRLGRRCVVRHNHTTGAGPAIVAEAQPPTTSAGVRVIRENATENVVPPGTPAVRTSGVPFLLGDNV